jgi:hypothetical protein
LIYTSADAVCNGDYESDIVLDEKRDKKKQKLQDTTLFGHENVINFKVFAL